MLKRTLWFSLACIACFVLLTVLLNACGSATDKSRDEPSVKNEDPVNLQDTVQTMEADIEVVLPAINDSLTDIAKFIAGIQPEHSVRLLKLCKDSAWREYASKISSMWKRFEHDRLNAMDTFATDELNQARRKHYNLFYPFSGPDLLHAVTFFPQADTVVMIALEPPGSLQIMNEKHLADSLPQYLASMTQSLHAILNWSFFITKKMFKDLRHEELNGAVHLLSWFAARRGYAVCNIQPSVMDAGGNTYICKSEADTVWRKHKTHGLCLTLRKGEHAMCVFYFSADLSDYGISKNKELAAFLAGYHFQSSFVKSASYLMHSSNFSKVRMVLLDRSNEHLQDDSGIPFSWFAARKEWKPALFGSYVGPIKIFNDKNQPDLVRTYDSLEVTKLKFGIGYKHRKEESTLMLFTRKGEK